MSTGDNLLWQPSAGKNYHCRFHAVYLLLSLFIEDLSKSRQNPFGKTAGFRLQVLGAQSGFRRHYLRRKQFNQSFTEIKDIGLGPPAENISRNKIPGRKNLH